MPFPFLLLIPVATKVINVVKNTEVGATVVESVKNSAMGNVMDTVLTKTGLLYDMEEGVQTVQSSVDTVSANVTEISQNIGQLDAGIAQIEGGIQTLQSGVDSLGASVAGVSENLGHLGEGIAQQGMMLSSIQSSISAIGMMSAVGCALSAVNVFQLIKVQRSLNRVEKKIDDGFVDLKAFFSENLENLLNEQQRQRLAQAYSHYRKALEQLQNSFLIQDPINKKLSINSCIDVFVQSLAIYDDKQEYQHINTPAKLRRLECSWSLEAAIAESRFLQDEYAASLHSYEKLRQRIIAEAEMLKLEMRESDYKFVVADLHWIFENDVKIINAKIDLLNHYIAHNAFKPIKIKASDTEQNENLFKNSELPSSRLYIDCLISTEKADSVKTRVIENKSSFHDIKYNYIDFNKLPLVHFCDIYVEQFGVNEIAEKSTINTKIIQLLENYFLEKKDINHRITLNDPQLRVFLSALNSNQSSEKEINFFNNAVKTYVEKFTQCILDDRHLDKEKRQKLKNIASELALSEKFSDKLNEMGILFHERNLKQYLTEYRKLLISLVILENSTSLSEGSKSTMLQFEQNIPLNKGELEENKRNMALFFYDEKNSIILNNDFNKINENNEVLVWKTQDKFQISEAQSKALISGCQKSIQQYREAFNALSAGKNQLSEMDRTVLRNIQRKNNLCDESTKKIINKGSFFSRFW